MTKLRLAPDLSLPLEAITETIAILGIRGSGKTNTAVVYAEELLAAGQQIVVIDPTDAWWGLKSSKDGQKPGYPVVVLGGKQQNLPLASTDGKLVADFVVEQGASVICSLRGFESKQQELAFTTAFLRRLYYVKGQQERPTPLALFIDEASRLVPQRVMGEDAACVGAVQQIVRQGRSSGFGVVLIDQRAATVNKDVLAQLEMLIVHRTTGPQDRKALREWVQQHDTESREGAFLDSLASLNQGQAWFWSPGWLNLFRKVDVRERKTFDSSRTPRAGEVVVVPKKIADVDIEALREKMAETIEKAKADDPKELRKKIAELERGAKAKPVQTTEANVGTETVRELRATITKLRKAVEAAVKFIVTINTQNFDVAGVDAAEIERAITAAVGKATQLIDQRLEARAKAIVTLRASAERIVEQLQGVLGNEDVIVDVAVARQEPFSVSTPSKRATVQAPRPSADGAKVGKTGARILGALAFYESVGKVLVPSSMAAAFVGMSASGGSWGARLSELRQAGYIVGSGTLELTDAGRAVADTANIPTSLDELHSMWLQKLKGKARAMLAALIAAYPRSLSKEALASAVEMEMSGGSFGARLSEIRSPGLLDDSVPRGEVRASDLLFPEGLR